MKGINMKKEVTFVGTAERDIKGWTKAFTLAEILITLAIIGIVAVMTVPTLVNNYQHKCNIVKWRKAYSQFTSVALRISEDYNVSTFQQALDAAITENYIKTGRYNSIEASIELFNKYFKVLKADCNGRCKGHDFSWGCKGILVDEYIGGVPGYKYLSGASAGYWVLGYYPTACFQTPDFVFALDANTSVYGRISVDVNGTKPPNVIGKDIFVLNMNNLRQVIPGGEGNFYSTSSYACDENAQYGGPACSAKYLKSY